MAAVVCRRLLWPHRLVSGVSSPKAIAYSFSLPCTVGPATPRAHSASLLAALSLSPVPRSAGRFPLSDQFSPAQADVLSVAQHFPEPRDFLFPPGQRTSFQDSVLSGCPAPSSAGLSGACQLFFLDWAGQ